MKHSFASDILLLSRSNSGLLVYTAENIVHQFVIRMGKNQFRNAYSQLLTPFFSQREAIILNIEGEDIIIGHFEESSWC